MPKPSDYDLLSALRDRECAIRARIRRDPRVQCWEWIGAKTYNGYGTFTLAMPAGNHRSVRAHRAVFMLTHDRAIGNGLTLHHQCHNPACVNPDHLVEMSLAMNNRRRTGIEALRYARRG